MAAARYPRSVANITTIIRHLAGVTFLLALALTLVGGLLWALNPEASTGFTIDGGGVATPEPAPQPAPTPTPDPSPPPEEPTPTPTPTPTEDAEELIAAAREPSATTVQVLEAGGGQAATEAAAAHLRDELGYDVVFVTSARVDVTRTTVWFSQGNEDEARALRARDARVAVVEANQGLNEATDLHVLVGPDWDGSGGG